MTRECEDAISRQAVLDLIDHYNSDGLGSVFYGYEQGEKFANEVNKLPPVKPQPKIGRWLHQEIMDYLDKNKVRHNHFMCQDCGFIHDFIDGHTAQYKYCPSCGAKMQEVEE
jgi:rubrerythrin